MTLHMASCNPFASHRSALAPQQYPFTLLHPSLMTQFDPNSMSSRTCTIARRSDPGPNGSKITGASTDPDTIVAAVIDLLEDGQSDLKWRAAMALQTEIVDVTSFFELRVRLDGAVGWWLGLGACRRGRLVCAVRPSQEVVAGMQGAWQVFHWCCLIVCWVAVLHTSKDTCRCSPPLEWSIQPLFSGPPSCAACGQNLPNTHASHLSCEAATKPTPLPSFPSQTELPRSQLPKQQDAIECGKWARGPWAGSEEDEQAVLEETGATLRCIPLQQPISIASGYSTCLFSGYQATEVAVFARAC